MHKLIIGVGRALWNRCNPEERGVVLCHKLPDWWCVEAVQRTLDVAKGVCAPSTPVAATAPPSRPVAAAAAAPPSLSAGRLRSMCCDKFLAENKEALKAMALAKPSGSKSLRQHWRRIGVREFQKLSLEAKLVLVVRVKVGPMRRRMPSGRFELVANDVFCGSQRPLSASC